MIRKINYKLVLIFLLFIVNFNIIHSQNYESIILTDSAKTLFNATKDLLQEELDAYNFSAIASLLERAVNLNPQNDEARYFLAYTYSRMNCPDARRMIHMNKDLMIKSSEQLEALIKIHPKYKGEIIALDPYSKIAAEWGSMALCYLYHHQEDSAIWAFKEGKRRGGYQDFYLENFRRTLDACDKNALLITSGDMVIFPLLFLQTIEHYRTDITVIDKGLLGTSWYPNYLAKNDLLKFDLPMEVIDTIEYISWKEKTEKIGNFSWKLKPTYNDEYLLRDDRVLLSLLKANKLEKTVYFTPAFDPNNQLSLTEYISNQIVVKKLIYTKTQEAFNLSNYKEKIIPILQLTKFYNNNSKDELYLLDNYRLDVLYKVDELLQKNEKGPAKELMLLLDANADEQTIPYCINTVNEYIENIRKRIDE